MAEAKTKETGASVDAFLGNVTDPARRAACAAVADIMREVSGEEPRMWGASIVGFGRYRYAYASGRTGEWPIIGFSPRKSDLTLYLMGGFDGFPELMATLGKYRTGKSCLYLKALDDVDLTVLRRLCVESVKAMEPVRLRP